MTQNYSIAGMHCMSCVGKITDALRNVNGVDSAMVTLDPPAVAIETGSPISVDRLNKAIAGAGNYQLTETQNTAAQATQAPKESLYPLFLIVGYIAGTTALVSVLSGSHSLAFLMGNFMAGFFLVFSFFKLLDLRGFSDAYRSYDLLARAMPGWASVYPFIELALGAAYLLRFDPLVTNIVTLALMLIGSAGVLKALLDKRTIRCACLGTALNLPMTKVTLVEDLGMAAMAAVMLVVMMK